MVYIMLVTITNCQSGNSSTNG